MPAVLAVLLLLVSKNQSLALISILFSTLSWCCLWSSKRGLIQQTDVAIGFMCLAMAVVGIVFQGTVRAAVGFIFVGAVACAGTFLDRKALIATVSVSVGSLSLLTWLETQGYLHAADPSVGWGQLIADLLALARVSQSSLERAHVDLTGMAEQVLLAERGNQPERTMRWLVNPNLQCHCDPHLTRIALDNLLGNAFKYTRDQASPHIEVGQWPLESAHAGTFFLLDNGVGFNMAHSDKLFKPFHRLHMPSAFDGTGIGLATVRRIVERHGGFIMAHAIEGQGAIFAFAFNDHVQPPSAQAVATRLQTAALTTSG